MGAKIVFLFLPVCLLLISSDVIIAGLAGSKSNETGSPHTESRVVIGDLDVREALGSDEDHVVIWKIEVNFMNFHLLEELPFITAHHVFLQNSEPLKTDTTYRSFESDSSYIIIQVPCRRKIFSWAII